MLPAVYDTPTTSSKFPLPHLLAEGRYAGLGLDLGNGIEEQEEEEEAEEEGEEIEPDPDGASKVLTRLDRMLFEIQSLTERGQAALATPSGPPPTPYAGMR